MERQADRICRKNILEQFNNTLPIIALTNIYLPYRLAQLRESGVQFRIRQQSAISPQPDIQPSSIVVRVETIAPILVLLAAGNVIGLIILMTEQFVHAHKFQTWPTIHIR